MNDTLKALIEKLHLKASTYPNPFAYQTKFGSLHQEETIFTDSKGQWKISGLLPKDMGWNGKEYVPRYELCMKLINEKIPKLVWTHFVYVTVWEHADMNELKRMIKAYIGYIPQPKTMKAIYELTQNMISAWKEQDLWYDIQDKAMAKSNIEELKMLLIERYRKGEEQRENYTYRYGSPRWVHFLSETEERELKEYHRMINGRCYLNETMAHGSGVMGLEQFSKEVNAMIHEIDKERSAKADQEKKEKLCYLLETNTLVRKLTSHYIQASKESKIYGVKDSMIQLVHRLYGYTTNEKNYYEKYNQLSNEYLKPCGITIWDLYYLARKTKENDEILPPATSPYAREKSYYYGDQLIIGEHQRMIKKVGTKYLYVEQGVGRITLHSARPYRDELLKRIG